MSMAAYSSTDVLHQLVIIHTNTSSTDSVFSICCVIYAYSFMPISMVSINLLSGHDTVRIMYLQKTRDTQINHV